MTFGDCMVADLPALWFYPSRRASKVTPGRTGSDELLESGKPQREFTLMKRIKRGGDPKWKLLANRLIEDLAQDIDDFTELRAGGRRRRSLC